MLTRPTPETDPEARNPVATDDDAGVRVIPDELVARIIGIDDAIALVEAAFAADARGAHQNFPVVRERLPDPFGGVFGIKSGFVVGDGILGLKAGGYWPGNRAAGLPPHQSTILLFDPASGRPAALIGANAITGLRTGAAGAVAAKYLARPDAASAGLIGCGAQGRRQLAALAKVRPLRRVRVWDRAPDAAAVLAADLGPSLGVPIELAPDAEGVVRSSDIVVTATAAGGVVVRDAWVRPGQHLTAIGADTVGKQELDPAILRRSTLVVDSRAQAARLGETQHLATDAGSTDPVHAELGEIVAGRAPGRRGPEEITVFDATGVTFQDLVVAAEAWRRCRAAGLGQVVRV